MEKRYKKTEVNGKLLSHHPNNPRKNLGDLTELKKSIEKNGILQNLTVIPVDGEGDDVKIEDAIGFYVLIGNRRFEAGKDILESFPVTIIEGLSQREQLSIMLEENMQRSDLTIIEQAEGFQMMLDLGETVNDIVEKTGFSETTVYHRLNIAKLDKKTLKKKFEDTEFQLTITDLYELERLQNEKDRNKILKEARSSREIKRLVNDKLDEIQSKEASAKVIRLLEEAGVEKMPETMERSYSYYSHYENIRDYELPKCKIPKKLNIHKSTKEKPVYYRICKNYYGVPYRIEVYEKKDKSLPNGEKLSEYEIRERKRKELRKRLEEGKREIDIKLRMIIASILEKKIIAGTGMDGEPVEIDEIKICEKLWNDITEEWCQYSKEDLIFSWTKKTWQSMENKERQTYYDLWEKAKPSLIDQMMFALIHRTLIKDVWDWDLKLNGRSESYIKIFDNLDDIYGYGIPKTFRDFMNGKGECWKAIEEAREAKKI